MTHEEPSRALYFSHGSARPRSVVEEVERAVRDLSGSWRGLRDHGSSADAIDRQLRSGHGLLMTAPEPVCAVVARVLENEGVLCSIVGNGPSPPHPGKKVLLLGRSYVIAGGFAFEARRS